MKSWRRTLDKDLGKMNHTWGEIKTIARNRVRWRAMIRALCPREDEGEQDDGNVQTDNAHESLAPWYGNNSPAPAQLLPFSRAALCLLNFFALGVHSEVSLYEKLPDQDIRPLTYDIKFLPWMDTKDWLLEGETKITFSSENGASELSFHFHHWPPLYFEIVSNELDHNVTIQSTTFNDTTDQVKVQLGEELQPGGTYEMYVKYEFIMTEEPGGQGIFKREYQEFGKTQYMIGTQFEDLGARRAFPCFDEPNLKAMFTLTIGYQWDYEAITNTPVVYSRPINDHLLDLLRCNGHVLGSCYAYPDCPKRKVVRVRQGGTNSL
ncbi:unnamed protein product [Cyprideis torosa]|uniref:Uncharacterized protein n=1 Tax=Cyprideis torosa TaxID=163714 RepID=A0A7R8WMU7_9CRUS|nr:unnamed protein product [Cyprideis torosa]CAG0899845.1 unnamed protein product [Cyprideis torosa]